MNQGGHILAAAEPVTAMTTPAKTRIDRSADALGAA
jgi:hypothetical protein